VPDQPQVVPFRLYWLVHFDVLDTLYGRFIERCAPVAYPRTPVSVGAPELRGLVAAATTVSVRLDEFALTEEQLKHAICIIIRVDESFSEGLVTVTPPRLR